MSQYGFGGSNSVSGDKKSMKVNKKSKSKKSNHKSKKGSPAADLSDRVLSTMEKHRENFFTITINPNPTQQTTEDPDPLVQCELMDGRDSFLQMARDKFWEFSSLRRTKYSSMCFLYELHVQLNERLQYNCNYCKQIVEIRFHCNTCEDFDLCVNCNGKVTHEHKLVRRTPENDPEAQNSKASAELNKKQAFMETLKNLPHAVTCRDANCRVRNCVRMRMIVQHAKNCEHKDQRNTCSNCKQFFQICCYHAKHCNAPKCVVPYCHNIRMKLRRQSDVLWQRRRAAMVGSGNPGSIAAAPATPQSSTQSNANNQQHAHFPSDQKMHSANQIQNTGQKLKPGLSNIQNAPQVNNTQTQAHGHQNIQQPQQQVMNTNQNQPNQIQQQTNNSAYQQMSQNMQNNVVSQNNQQLQQQTQQHTMMNNNQVSNNMGNAGQNPQNISQMGGNMYHSNQQQQQQHVLVSQQQQQAVNSDMNQMHKQIAVSSTAYGNMHRTPNMVPSGMQMQPQQMMRHPPNQNQFQARPQGQPQTYVTTQQVQNPNQIMSAGPNGGQNRQWQQQQQNPPGAMYLVQRGGATPGMQQMQGK